MARIRFLIIISVLGMGLSVSGMAKDVTFIENGVAKTAIYVSTNDCQSLKPAIDDLRSSLEKMSGATVPVITNTPQPGDKLLPMLVGDLAAKQFGFPKKKCPSKQGWRLVVSSKGIGFIGESDEAVSYAVYELLDRLGCRWFMPGEMGEVIPNQKTVTLEETDISEVPATIWRGIWYCDNDFRRRNRMADRKHELSAAQTLEGHITKEQRAAHPDWCAEINGKRNPENDRLCWGNTEVAQAIADDIIAKLDKTYTGSISLSPFDGISFCQCEKCKALDTGDRDPSMDCISLSDRQVHFCNQIVERVHKKYPDVLFGMLAYVQYTRPPLREKPHPNLVPEIAPITYCRAHSMANPECASRQSLKPIIEGWAKVADKLAMYQYAYNLAEVAVPYPMMTQWSEDIPIFYANNVKFWQPETMPNFASTLPGLYLGIRMSWYTTAKPQDILNEFFTRFYGAAAEPMRKHWQIIDDAWTKVPEHAGCGFGHIRRFTPETLKAARDALNQAMAACKTDMEKRRVKLTDESFKEFELFMKMRCDLAAGRLPNLGNDAASWITTWDRLMEEYKPEYAFSPYGKTYFEWFWKKEYEDGARIAKDFAVLPVLRAWRYMQDKEKKGKSLGWSKPDFDDQLWKITDPGVDTWSALGFGYDYYGPVWYRTSVSIPAIPAGKKVYLWISSTDGTAEVFVNGTLIPYVNDKGEKKDMFDGYCAPASFDITSAIKPGAENQVTIIGTHTYLNELGTGGLVGPVMVYHEKP